MLADTLPIVEIFHSLQGEGLRVGEPATFIRFAGCNLRCSWCDTPYSWSAEGLQAAEATSLEQIAAQAREAAVVLTGGEPLLHRRRLPQLIELLRERGAQHITVETNATIVPDPDSELWQLVDLWSLSPKLPGSGEVIDLSALREFAACPARELQLKFVIADLPADYEALWQALDQLPELAHVQLILQPDGLRPDYADALRELSELVCADDVRSADGRARRARIRVIPQTHRVAWGVSARGV